MRGLRRGGTGVDEDCCWFAMSASSSECGPQSPAEFVHLLHLGAMLSNSNTMALSGWSCACAAGHEALGELARVSHVRSMQSTDAKENV